jgi:ubiquinone biosynthesis protein COQ9
MNGELVPSEKIMLAAIRHAMFDGWVPRILVLGARDAGFEDAAAEIAFPGGIDELIESFSRWADDQMLAALEARDLSTMKVRERVALAVRTRLEILTTYREAVRRLNSHFTLPGNALAGARLVGETVNAIWYSAGDAATDFAYYTKRGLLAAVYGATVLYWLADESEGFAETWAFLDRRLDNVMNIPKTRARLQRALPRLPNPLRIARLMRRRVI